MRRVICDEYPLASSPLSTSGFVLWDGAAVLYSQKGEIRAAARHTRVLGGKKKRKKKKKKCKGGAAVVGVSSQDQDEVDGSSSRL